MPDDLLKPFIQFLADFFGVYASEVRPYLAVALVSLTCGLMGSLVIGSRMAFFSDAMAHTAFAGVAFALLAIVVSTGIRTAQEAEEHLWLLPLVMGTIGTVVGLAVVYVQESTSLTTDTVIGVFFAASLGIAALLLPMLRGRTNLDTEQIIFGQLAGVQERDLLMLLALSLATFGIVAWRYNAFVLGSFNPSLARSRGLSVRFNTYLFVVLLAWVVNLSIQAVGILLINALLIVPAAAASNMAGHLRQLFLLSVAGTVLCGVLGYHLSTKLVFRDQGQDLRPGPGGMIVLTCVAWFAVSFGVRAVRRRFFAFLPDCRHETCSHDHAHGQYHHD